MEPENDRDLRAAFQRQRALDAAGMRQFERVLTGRTPRGESPSHMASRFVFVCTVMVLLVAGTLVVREKRSGGRSDRVPDMLSGLTSSVWRAPTDFLLDAPKPELTQTVPRFSTSIPGLAPMNAGVSRPSRIPRS